MYRVGSRIMVLTGAITLWCGAWMIIRTTLPLPENALMAPLLPEGEHQSACFRGDFEGLRMNVEDWSKVRLEPTTKLSPDGQPYMRPVPPVLKDQAVRSFTLQLVHDTRTADYDWIYNFRLLAEVQGVGTMFAAGECPWYAKDKVWDGSQITGNTTDLFCYIDCDGGGFDVERVAGAPALTITFDPRIGLKMKGGCGGGGSYRIKPATSGIFFRLQTASAKACEPLEEWAGR